MKRTGFTLSQAALALVIALFLFAVALQAMYAKADTIVAPWVIHICGDLAMMIIAVTLVALLVWKVGSA